MILQKQKPEAPLYEAHILPRATTLSSSGIEYAGKIQFLELRLRRTSQDPILQDVVQALNYGCAKRTYRYILKEEEDGKYDLRLFDTHGEMPLTPDLQAFVFQVLTTPQSFSDDSSREGILNDYERTSTSIPLPPRYEPLQLLRGFSLLEGGLEA